MGKSIVAAAALIVLIAFTCILVQGDPATDAAETIKIDASVDADTDLEGDAQSRAKKAREKAYEKAGLENARQRERRFNREYRKMGATPLNVLRIARKLQADGQWTGNAADDKASIGMVLMEENPQAFVDADAAVVKYTKGGVDEHGEPLGFDWDSFSEFLDRLLEWIMKIMALFSDTTPLDAGSDLAYVHPYQLVA